MRLPGFHPAHPRGRVLVDLACAIVLGAGAIGDTALLEHQRALLGQEETWPFVECLRAGHPDGDSCPASLVVYRRKLDEPDALIGELAAAGAQVGERLARAELGWERLAAEVPGRGAGCWRNSPAYL